MSFLHFCNYVILIISIVLTGLYMLIWRRHYDVHITLLFVLIPIVNLAHLLLAESRTLDAALLAAKLIYLGGPFLQLLIMLSVFGLCRINVNRWIRLALLLLCIVGYFFVLTIGRIGLFYKSATLVSAHGVSTLHKVYGPMHTFMQGIVILYFLISVVVIVRTMLRNNQIGRKILIMMIFPEIVSVFGYFIGRILVPDVELLPLTYVSAQLVYLLIARRLNLYDVTETVMAAMAETGDTGFITFDSKYNYLGSNTTARQIMPELNELSVDLSLKRSSGMDKLLMPWLKAFDENPTDTASNSHFYEKDDRIYLCTVGELSLSKRVKGYRIVMTDDTLDRKYIKLLDGFNQDLKDEVARKTADIVRMSDNQILSMAVMVESRDNSTGGHIRRTSEVVRLLVDTMRKKHLVPEGYDLNDDFCRMLIKAAPMHDLGKIAVDDAILRKPGRYTPEEYEKMKIHSTEGARIVHEILKDTDDRAFHVLAENVAHYHHERWDGKGYPEGLKGDAIPPEARIMAVADVYDALVSKRVYKDSMSFEQADSIMLEGMGDQFDPHLKEAYEATRPALEAYYSSLDDTGKKKIGEVCT